MKHTTLISNFSTSDLSGHSLVDDERYLAFFIDCGASFRLYTSRYSVNRIIGSRPGAHHYLRAIEDSSVDIKSGSRVIFIGFTERDVLAFLMKNLLRRPRLILIATNNFSVGRVNRLRRVLKLFLCLIRPFLDRLVLHTAYEQQLVAGLDRRVAVKSVVKKHHLMIPHHLASQVAEKGPIISYYGPEKHDKPMAPFIDLIQADTERRFIYRIYRVESTDLVDRLPDLANRTNVEVIEDWQSHKSYLESVKTSTLVFLSHNHAFEGKLSGNLCDCFALLVPYIARAMEPMNSYEAQYGSLGYLVDFEEANWARRFLERYNDETYTIMRCNLERLSKDHSIEAINADLTAYLLH